MSPQKCTTALHVPHTAEILPLDLCLDPSRHRSDVVLHSARYAHRLACFRASEIRLAGGVHRLYLRRRCRPPQTPFHHRMCDNGCRVLPHAGHWPVSSTYRTVSCFFFFTSNFQDHPLHDVAPHFPNMSNHFALNRSVTGISIETDAVFLFFFFLHANDPACFNRLMPNMRNRERVFSVLAMLGAFIGGAGLLFLSIFDTKRYPSAHRACLLVFIVGVGLSAIFSIIEVLWLLSQGLLSI